MKIRYGFVSNSSSSSFVIISSDTSGLDRSFMGKYTGQELIIDGSSGYKEFGWAEIQYLDTWSKINFAYLQATDVGNLQWLEMLERVLVDYTGARNIIWDYPKDGYMYVDHQSSSVEGTNTEIFDSEETLKQFLFNFGSYLQGGNDNSW